MLIQLGDNIFFSEIEETARSTTTVPKKNRVSAGKRPTTGQETTQRRQTRVRKLYILINYNPIFPERKTRKDATTRIFMGGSSPPFEPCLTSSMHFLH